MALHSDILLDFGGKVTAFFPYLQIFVTICHRFAFDLNLAKLKKSEKTSKTEDHLHAWIKSSTFVPDFKLK